MRLIIIPKSAHVKRKQQNIDILDFELSKEDMDTIPRLVTGRSLFFDHHEPETVNLFMGWK